MECKLCSQLPTIRTEVSKKATPWGLEEEEGEYVAILKEESFYMVLCHYALFMCKH